MDLPRFRTWPVGAADGPSNEFNFLFQIISEPRFRCSHFYISCVSVFILFSPSALFDDAMLYFVQPAKANTENVEVMIPGLFHGLKTVQ
jgi:hypothetical protein